MKRTETTQIRVGKVYIGGDAPVTVQSMCNTKTWDVEATVTQIRALRAAGVDIVRLAVPDERSAFAIEEIKNRTDVPLVADIHFDYRLALLCAERGIDKIRINPGNIGGEENVKAVAESCRERKIPIRIGVNAGSLEKPLLEKYGHPCPEAMVESARRHAALLLKYGFEDICLSLKSSTVPLTIAAYRLAAEEFPFPLHLGVTETGTEWNGTIQSAVGIGTLLSEEIGNTIRVSLTADPVREVSAGIAILKAAGLRTGGVKFVSCPTCGRTEINLIALAEEVENRVRNLDRDITVAVMGCVVNGPGEAREADYGIAGGKERGILFRKGEVLGTYPYEELLARLMELIEES
ncbi:MAG: flavodoxin-dependent (E)-4-hydroxy-3-methylbut-2-enyl-diphosphate synthase [Oscillospiraceae bacterium]|nr:flavodoxin-dependent (E)-4-hydroxy-3-methylbut-2-enyl-diphosphate synthase [Oscillospiraceae bacterium]MBQ3757627.1 flavodoxin-dependent (E)-4-hydroxy-3-methylbut-2-enyl-diphosphate synthase [Oscillospiraceae bacterium]